MKMATVVGAGTEAGNYMGLSVDGLTRMSYRPEKIISGGQTGADRGGLLAGRDLGIKTGGWAPKGYLTENGPDWTLKSFGLVQHSSPNYPPRTRMNCQESDFTAVFGEVSSKGSSLTITCCREDKIPYLLNPDAEELREFARMLEAGVVNIAGNRESKCPGIQERVRGIVRDAFQV